MSKEKNISIYLCRLLRHRPEEAGLDMDIHGWVSVDQLLEGVNRRKKCGLTRAQLEQIVAEDEKGRYRFDSSGERIKACQGHSIPWVEPELTFCAPPEFLYHGTSTAAMEKILASGGISKMKRHAVHMHAEERVAWQSARRWHLTPVLLKISAGAMYEAGMQFGVSENDVWCTEFVPKEYICDFLYQS